MYEVLVKVQAKQYKLAKELGFKPSKNVVRTTTGNNYFLEDYDFKSLQKTINKNIKEFKGVK